MTSLNNYDNLRLVFLGVYRLKSNIIFNNN